MKKSVAIILALFIVICNFLFCADVAYAEDYDYLIDDFNSIVPEGVEIDISDTSGNYLGIDMILKEIISSFESKGGELSLFFLTLFGFSILICIASRGRDADGEEIGKSVSVSVLMLASVSIFSSIYPLFESLKSSLLTLVNFFGGVIPVLTGVNTLLAESATAGVQATNMSITLAIIELFSVKCLMPLSFAFFTVSFIGGVGGSNISSFSKGIKDAFVWGVGIVSAVLAAVISIQSVVASARDSALLRAARYAASGTIPVVGTTVASALGTLGGGLAFLKSSIGASSIAVILSITLSPLIVLLLYRLAFSICSFFLEFCSVEDGIRCFNAFRNSIDAVIAVYSMSTLVCVVELVVFLRGGVASV